MKEITTKKIINNNRRKHNVFRTNRLRKFVRGIFLRIILLDLHRIVGRGG